MNTTNPLQDLFTRLTACPTWNNRFAGETAREAWESFMRNGCRPDECITPAAMAGLMLHDERFAQLLSKVEREQLSALVHKARDLYLREINPPADLGAIIISQLEE